MMKNQQKVIVVTRSPAEWVRRHPTSLDVQWRGNTPIVAADESYYYRFVSPERPEMLRGLTADCIILEEPANFAEISALSKRLNRGDK